MTPLNLSWVLSAPRAARDVPLLNEPIQGRGEDSMPKFTYVKDKDTWVFETRQEAMQY